MQDSTPLKTIEAVEQAVRDGKRVYWKSSPVVETKAHRFLVNTPISVEKYVSRKLTTIIQVYGVTDFYYLGE